MYVPNIDSESAINDSYKISLTERIVRNLAHEIRNPLTNVMLGLEQLKAEFPEGINEGADVYFSIIKRNCDRINSLITLLVNSAKHEELNKGTHSIHLLLDETLNIVNEKIQSGKITVSKRYSEILPQIPVDGGKLKIAFSNIISNAIEAMDKNSCVLEIETAFENEDCVIRFKDNGRGISNEDIDRIFDPFFRFKSAGAGLGLTATENIILSHKGKIKVKSVPEVGTTFSVYLPCL